MSTHEDASELTLYPDPSLGLDVAREDLAEVLGIVARATRKGADGASLRFDDRWLYVESRNMAARAPAKGFWPLTIIVGMSWVRRLAKNLPPGDPIRLCLKDGRIYVNRYSEPCAWTTEDRPQNPRFPEESEKQLILEVAKVLEPLRIGREDVERLVKSARERGASSWRNDEAKLIALVAQAWALLAPFGIETPDLRRMIDESVRNAWGDSK